MQVFGYWDEWDKEGTCPDCHFCLLFFFFVLIIVITLLTMILRTYCIFAITSVNNQEVINDHPA